MPLVTVTHPTYNPIDWEKWRLCYEGGERFIDKYVRKFSKRESPKDFSERKKFTPTATFAKGAINEIKNSIFQRTADVTRKGGPSSYQEAIEGRAKGVDLSGATMNWFIGHNIISELLVMKKVGVFIDNGQVGPTLADRNRVHPYFYHYCVENIRNWHYERGRLVALLLRDHIYKIDPETHLPKEEVERFRHFWIEKNQVFFQLYDANDKQIGSKILLRLPEIPFIPFEITESLMKDVCNHQIALMNAESADMSFILKANVPFYTEQSDGRGNSKVVQESQTEYNSFVGDPTCETPPPLIAQETQIGASEGRFYTKERPGFIHPSSEPINASMDKQKNLKEDIRLLVHLALSNVQAKMASADSKKFDLEGLESGLSYIGLELEHGERKLGELWAAYEQTSPPTILYPKRWSLKTDSQIHEEVEKLEEIRDSVPSKTFQKEISKRIASTLVGNHVSSEVLETIHNEIASSPVITSDATIIIQDVQEGLVSRATASKARGYDPTEMELANEEHAARLARIMKSQSNPAARGVPDLGGNAKDEKDA